MGSVVTFVAYLEAPNSILVTDSKDNRISLNFPPFSGSCAGVIVDCKCQLVAAEGASGPALWMGVGRLVRHKESLTDPTSSQLCSNSVLP